MSGVNDIRENFSEFDKQLRFQAQKRKTEEESRLKSVVDGIDLLEQSINSEIKHREQDEKALLAFYNSRIQETKSLIEQEIAFQVSNVDCSIKTMHESVRELNENFRQSQISIRQEIESKASTMDLNLKSFEEKFENDAKIRLQEEKAIEDQLDLHALRLQERFNALLTQRETCFQSIRSKLDSLSESQSRKASILQETVAHQSSTLLNSLRIESSKRQQDDQEISDTLNAYMSKLQASLKIIDSTEL